MQIPGANCRDSDSLGPGWGLRFCVSSSSLLVPGWSSYEETKPPKPESSHRGSPILKPRRRRSKRGDGVGGRGQSSVPEPWRAGQPCSGDEGGTWSKGWLGSLALKEGWSQRAERLDHCYLRTGVPDTARAKPFICLPNTCVCPGPPSGQGEHRDQQEREESAPWSFHGASGARK